MSSVALRKAGVQNVKLLLLWFFFFFLLLFGALCYMSSLTPHLLFSALFCFRASAPGLPPSSVSSESICSEHITDKNKCWLKRCIICLRCESPWSGLLYWFVSMKGWWDKGEMWRGCSPLFVLPASHYWPARSGGRALCGHHLAR